MGENFADFIRPPQRFIPGFQQQQDGGIDNFEELPERHFFPGEIPREIPPHIAQWDLDQLRPPLEKKIKKFTKEELEQLEGKKAEFLRKKRKEINLGRVDRNLIALDPPGVRTQDNDTAVDFTDIQKARYIEIIDATPEDQDFMTPEEYYLSLEPEREIIRKKNLAEEPNNTKYWAQGDYLNFIVKQNEAETEFSEETSTLIHTAVAWLYKYATKIKEDENNNIINLSSSTNDYNILISNEVYQVYLQKKPILENQTKLDDLIVERGNFDIENGFEELMEHITEEVRPIDKSLIPALNEGDACDICLEFRKNYIIVPCGHICLCGNCQADYSPDAAELVKQKCPICKEKIRGIFKTFN